MFTTIYEVEGRQLRGVGVLQYYFLTKSGQLMDAGDPGTAVFYEEMVELSKV